MGEFFIKDFQDLKDEKFVNDYINENYEKIKSNELYKDLENDNNESLIFLIAASMITKDIISPLEEKLAIMIYGEVSYDILSEIRNDFSEYFNREEFLKASNIYNIAYYNWLMNELYETSKLLD